MGSGKSVHAMRMMKERLVVVVREQAWKTELGKIGQGALTRCGIWVLDCGRNDERAGKKPGSTESEMKVEKGMKD